MPATRFDAFTAALERINVGDMTLYAIPGDEAEIDRARETAHGVARERGLEPALEAARQEVVEFVAESYREAAAGLGYIGGTSPTIGFGPDDDRLRVMQSLADAVIAVVLDDALEEADRASCWGPGTGCWPSERDDRGRPRRHRTRLPTVSTRFSRGWTESAWRISGCSRCRLPDADATGGPAHGGRPRRRRCRPAAAGGRGAGDGRGRRSSGPTLATSTSRRGPA